MAKQAAIIELDSSWLPVKSIAYEKYRVACLLDDFILYKNQLRHWKFAKLGENVNINVETLFLIKCSDKSGLRMKNNIWPMLTGMQ